MSDEEQDISIEEVKQFVNEKRRNIKILTPEEKQKRLDNLARGRETMRRNREMKNKEIKKEEPPQPPPPKITIKKQKPIKEDEGYETLIEEEQQHSGPLLTRHKSYDNDIDKFKTLEEKLNNINDLILKSLEKKIRPKRVVKPKVVNTLDLTVSDNDVNNIISESKNNKNTIKQDKKLQEFLEALKK